MELLRKHAGISVQEKEAAALKALEYFPLQMSSFPFTFSQLSLWGLFPFMCSAVEQLSFVLPLCYLSTLRFLFNAASDKFQARKCGLLGHGTKTMVGWEFIIAQSHSVRELSKSKIINLTDCALPWS